jgi:hypothetical protein
MFYGNHFKGWFEGLADEISRRHNTDEQYRSFMSEAVTFCKSVRITRNCVEHKKPNERVEISDFTLTPLNQINPPMIAVYHPKFTQPKISVTNYMSQMVEHIANVFEMMVAFMCSRNIQSFTTFPIQVVELPEDERKNKFVKYSYGLSDGNQIIPAS